MLRSRFATLPSQSIATIHLLNININNKIKIKIKIKTKTKTKTNIINKNTRLNMLHQLWQVGYF